MAIKFNVLNRWSGKVQFTAEIECGDDAAPREDRDVERRLRLWVADCAARVLHIFERDHPTDMRPRRAIDAARAFARGEIGDAARAAAWAAGTAAWEAAWAAARAAARAAVGSAAWEAAGSAARAAALAAAWAAAWAAEEAWQYDRLIERLMGGEPEDWPLPEIKKAAR